MKKLLLFVTINIFIQGVGLAEAVDIKVNAPPKAAERIQREFSIRLNGLDSIANQIELQIDSNLSGVYDLENKDLDLRLAKYIHKNGFLQTASNTEGALLLIPETQKLTRPVKLCIISTENLDAKIKQLTDPSLSPYANDIVMISYTDVQNFTLIYPWRELELEKNHNFTEDSNFKDFISSNQKLIIGKREIMKDGESGQWVSTFGKSISNMRNKPAGTLAIWINESSIYQNLLKNEKMTLVVSDDSKLLWADNDALEVLDVSAGGNNSISGSNQSIFNKLLSGAANAEEPESKLDLKKGFPIEVSQYFSDGKQKIIGSSVLDINGNQFNFSSTPIPELSASVVKIKPIDIFEQQKPFDAFLRSGITLDQVKAVSDKAKQSGKFVFKGMWAGMPLSHFLAVWDEILLKLTKSNGIDPLQTYVFRYTDLAGFLTEQKIDSGKVVVTIKIYALDLAFALTEFDCRELPYSHKDDKWYLGGKDIRNIPVDRIQLSLPIARVLFNDPTLTPETLLKQFITSYKIEVPDFWKPDTVEINKEGQILKTYRVRDPRGFELVFFQNAEAGICLLQIINAPNEEEVKSQFN